MAGPPFADVGVKSKRREAFWYRRRFRLEGPVPAVATVKLHKAMYGTRVLLNGTLLGDHLPCFTPGSFDARRALRTGENEIVVRIGAFRDAAGPTIPSGLDFEKKLYIPGIYDSVELILSGTPHLESVQVAPEIAAKTARVQAVVRNVGAAIAAPRSGSSSAKPGRSGWRGRSSGQANCRPAANGPWMCASRSTVAASGRRRTRSCTSWRSTAERTGSTTRFGMREFRFDPATGRAVLNGQPYFMRGSNVMHLPVHGGRRPQGPALAGRLGAAPAPRASRTFIGTACATASASRPNRGTASPTRKGC